MPPSAGARAPSRDPRSSGETRSLALLVAAFTTIALGFFASTLYGELRASRIDREAAHIETNSLPSVELLAGAQAALRHLEAASEELAHGTADERARAVDRVAQARRELDRDFTAETTDTGMYPGEAELTTAAADELRTLDALVDRLLERASLDPAAGQAVDEREVHAAIDRTDSAIERVLSVNATQGVVGARQIASVRAASVRTSLGLDAVCIVFSAAAAFVALRALRRQRAAERAREELLETRGHELEMFSRRVAHDLLSPLAALSFTLDTVKRRTAQGAPIDEPLARAFGCLKRSQRLVDNVLEFARSAASPASSERASLRDAIDGVVDEVRAEDLAGGGGGGRGVAIETLPFEGDVLLPCAPGILASVLSNLVRNAVKYIGEAQPDSERSAAEATDPRVAIRVFPRAAEVRVEIEDTGPGIPPDVAAHVFEPYFRAPNNPKPGIGLGLATVKRFVEAHHGRVGVLPAPTRGTIFWFELPRIPASSPAALPAIPIGNGVTGS